MSKNIVAKIDKVPFGQKIAFGLGMLANQMFPAVLGIFMVVLIQDLKFPAWMYSLLFFVPRVFDSILDPIMGFISDNTKSRWGRRRHYVMIGAVVIGISFSLMWQMNRESSIEFNFVYFLIWSLIFYVGLTIFSIPYVAMGYEMSDDFHERTSIMAVSQWIGQWAWVIAPWFWVIMYDPKWFPSADVATKTLAIWVGVIFMICAMIPAIFIKSKSTLNENYDPLNIKTIGGSLKKIFIGFKDAFKIKQFRKLCIATFFIFNAFNTVAGFTFFIVVYYLFNGSTNEAGIWPTLFGSLGALATTFIVIPTVAWLSRKIGKRRAFIYSQGVSILGYILLWFLFVPGKPYLFIFALPFFSFGIGALFTLMMSMTADVCDLDELASGKRREGIFGAIYWWMVKFGFAIAGGLSGLIMYIVGFNPDLPSQPEGAITGLRIFFSLVPILGTLVAMYVMRDYDLTEERANEVSQQLKDRKLIRPSGYTKSALASINDWQGLTEREITERHKYLYTTQVDFSSLSREDLHKDFTSVFQKGIPGICFGAYGMGQQPGDLISEDLIRKRLEVLDPHTQWVRIFSCTNGHEKIPKIAKEMGLKTMVGAWLNSNTEENDAEIKSLIELLRQNLVDIAAIGNEVLYREELNEEALIKYIQQVKQFARNTPVGCVDIYNEFLSRPQLTAACDLILANFYPFWEGADIRISGYYLQEMYRKTKEVANGKQVIIAETGWPAQGEVNGNAVPSKENVMEYFIKVQLWAKHENIDLFYFSSFDESWKMHTEGWAGTSWGLWDANENFKYA
jgi:GPH family glycoside/pentoside/hexuronide:cation symporter